ncbi:aKG-HExxH-type peptide beta-hydroxylase [Paenibacillus sp. GCM10027626]|uniref:aKG-HExxH-type peptide beta-hydroxylase n=1 Tax=Paenibacillus sp. GCM10027626 TaxID=3273411 RepID=UPI0036256D9D
MSPVNTPHLTGFSLNHLRGAIFITSENNVLETIDHLVHENGHNKLDILNDLHPLIEPSSQEDLYPSPWRTDLRPMEGLLHGAYVFTLVRYA